MAHTPFHGLMQPGQRPSMQFQQLNQAYQSDPRRILGQALMGQGASSAPVRTPLQGLGRLSSALVGAYLKRKAGDAQVERETAMTDQIMGMLPENATAGQRAFAAANPTAFAQMAGQAQFAPPAVFGGAPWLPLAHAAQRLPQRRSTDGWRGGRPAPVPQTLR